VVESVKLAENETHRQAAVVVVDQVNDEDTCSSAVSQASESLLSSCRDAVYSNGTATALSPSSSSTVMIGEKPPTHSVAAISVAAAEAGVSMATGGEKTDDNDDADVIIIDATNDCHLSQSSAAITFAANNNNNNRTHQSMSSSPCCVLDATRLSATAFHGDVAVSRVSDAAHCTGQYISR